MNLCRTGANVDRFGEKVNLGRTEANVDRYWENLTLAELGTVLPDLGVSESGRTRAIIDRL